MSQEQNEENDQTDIQLERKKERERSRRMNETNEQSRKRLEKERERNRSKRMNETEEERHDRLQKKRKGTQTSRTNETAEQRQDRLKKKREGAQAIRTNESEEQRLHRLEQQRKRNQENRAKKKIQKLSSNHLSSQQQNIRMGSIEMEALESSNSVDTLNQSLSRNTGQKKNNTPISLRWPEPIAGSLKETCLQRFRDRMSMSTLAEIVCAICNVRSPRETSKAVPTSTVVGNELLKVSDETNAFIMSTQLPRVRDTYRSASTALNTHVVETPSNVDPFLSGNIPMTSCITSDISTVGSPSFYCENNTVLYANGLFQQNRVEMCTLCQKCHGALSKGRIPKFSAANGAWLGDIPEELQDLTIPEEKLISLYRHNSCVIKLHSPFHSATTSQAALKGNCITFLQNMPNIVKSLPLKLDDLCDTLKVIFVGSRPPERIHLKKVLTVRKRKVVRALQWLKKYNALYQTVEINLENIAELPENDVPDSIMSTIEQRIGDEGISSERVGYIPDPLSDPSEPTTSETIPVSNR